MKPTIEILISSPVSGSEAAALRDLVSALQPPALILSNFELVLASSSREIDFVVITEQRAELIELKHFTCPVKGTANGHWELEVSPQVFEPYTGPNPWEQAASAKMALSDAMREFARNRKEMPRPTRRQYFEEVDASVTIYPKLLVGSRLWKGNFKAFVRSFPDTLQALTSCPLPVQPSWKIDHWRVFALEHLGLRPATLQSAIDVCVFAAQDEINEYLARLRRPALAPLLDGQSGELVGEAVIQKLCGAGDVVLLGRSGLGKSFHLEHLRRALPEGEIPVLLNAGCYQGDLNRAIYKSIGQYTRLSPGELVDAINRIGSRSVIIVDGWPNDLRRSADLADNLAAFKVRYGARLVTAAQSRPLHPLFAQTTEIQLAPLRDEHKVAIFAFHAGQRIERSLEGSLDPFSTAFDLAIAGRSQCAGPMAQTQSELYDAYLRCILPSAAARSLLRRLACFMGDEFKPVLPISELERIAETFARDSDISISFVDDVVKCRALSVGGDVVCFEHDLLKDFLRAQQLLRETDPSCLISKLHEPRYCELSGFVASLLTEQSILERLLVHATAGLLTRAFRGFLNERAKTFVRAECERFLEGCRDAMTRTTIAPIVGTSENGKRWVSSAEVLQPLCASGLEHNICEVITENLDDPELQNRFIELLQLGEWALKDACLRAGREYGVKSIAIWRELLRKDIFCSHEGPRCPLLLMCHLIRQNLMFSRRTGDEFPLRTALLTRLQEHTIGNLGILILAFDLRYREAACAGDTLEVAREAWDTGNPILQMEALDLLHSNADSIRKAGRESETIAIDLLEKCDVSKNIMLSTQWCAARSCFEGFEIDLNLDIAVQEFRNVLAVADAGDDPLYQFNRESDPTLTFEQFIAGWASSFIGKIFEEVFQGLYYEAYDSLSDEEKGRILVLALSGKEPVSLFTSWYLSQLIELRPKGVEQILARYGSRIDADNVWPQESVEAFTLANEAWAGFGSGPIPYGEISSDDHRAWAIIGELIFWIRRGMTPENAGRIKFLSNELLSVPAAIPDVMRRLAPFRKWTDRGAMSAEIVKHFREPIRKALEKSLEGGGPFTSVFPGAEFFRDEIILETIRLLADIGSHETITQLRLLADDARHGKAAICAIEDIEKRLVAGRLAAREALDGPQKLMSPGLC
jgi:Nuclease-related domain